MTPRLTIGITTRNRPEALRACIASLAAVAALAPEVLVFDDASDVPVGEQLTAGDVPVRVIRDTSAPGYIVGRNRLVREARASSVLLLDDDTRLMSDAAVLEALRVLDGDASIAAVAFAQAEKDGTAWPATMQPSPAARPVIVPTFIGFAHMVRRADFLAVGGYREQFEFYGEEKDFGLRMFAAGKRIVYLPDALIVHAADPGGRDPRRYLRFVSRNDCLMALYNDPLPRLMWMLPARFALYFRMRRGWNIRDPWGGLWLAGNVLHHLPAVRAERRPIAHRTIRAWMALRRHETPYSGSIQESHA
jgi:GT2 family glycosyltransferase